MIQKISVKPHGYFISVINFKSVYKVWIVHCFNLFEQAKNIKNIQRSVGQVALKYCARRGKLISIDGNSE